MVHQQFCNKIVLIYFQKNWWLVYQNIVNYGWLLHRFFVTIYLYFHGIFDKTFAILLWMYIVNTFDFSTKCMIIFEWLFNMVHHQFCNKNILIYCQGLWLLVYQYIINYSWFLHGFFDTIYSYLHAIFNKTFAILLWMYIKNTYEFIKKFIIIFEWLCNMINHQFCNKNVSIYYQRLWWIVY
jgi:hypothetical protein